MMPAPDNEQAPFPPAPNCLLCQQRLEEIGGRRLITCTQSLGVLIGTSPKMGRFKNRKVFRLGAGGALVIGDRDPGHWSPEVIERARQQAEAGYHP